MESCRASATAGGNLIAYHIAKAVDDRQHDHIKQRDGNLVDQAAEGENRALQPLAALHLQVVDQVGEHGDQKHHRHPNREIGEEAQHNIGDEPAGVLYGMTYMPMIKVRISATAPSRDIQIHSVFLLIFLSSGGMIAIDSM